MRITRHLRSLVVYRAADDLRQSQDDCGYCSDRQGEEIQPAAGWEKGQIENQVGNVREWLFTPRVKFETLDDLNRWLAQRCHELSNRKHPDFPQTVAECFQQEQPLLWQITTPFAGYVEHLMKVSRTCLVHIDRNQYSVPAQWSGKVVSVRVFADHLDIVAEVKTIAMHQRSFLLRSDDL